MEQARGDERWRLQRATPAEIAAARAYAWCLHAAGYLTVTGGLRTEEDNKIIRTRAGELAAIRRTVRASVTAAAATVRDGPG